MCARCAELESLVAEYEKALEGAIWLDDEAVDRLVSSLRISRQQAQAVFGLYKSKAGLTNHQLDDLLPNKDHADEGRQPYYSKAVVFSIRKRLGKDFVLSQPSGYSLSDLARSVVAQVLQGAVLESVAA